MPDQKAKIEVIRHSLSHVMAAAVQEMFPEAKLAIGPAIENGFYYDFDLSRNLTPDDLPKIEKKMKEIIARELFFEKRDSTKQKEIEFLQKIGQPYKIELVQDIEGEEVSFYSLKDANSGEFVFIDLCKGPHVEKTSDLNNVAWKLDKIAGAYWRGDEKNKMLQRIYALAFGTKEELDAHVKMREEAEKRDHKRIGTDLDLFSFHPECPGMPFWHEKGMVIWNQLEAFGKTLRKKYGYIEVKTPILAKNTLWITSGHWDHYRDGMFTFEIDNDTYGVKPMDCPFNILIYKTRQRSYRDLPMRYTEIGRVFRKEKSGELNGLLRVQEITQDDSHVILRSDQVQEEIGRLIDMTGEFYAKLGLTPNFFLSTRPDDYMGEIEMWDKAESDLRSTLKTKNIEYDLKEKDGAFYGPKIDVNVLDALGRSWQVATIQLDFQLPGRFDCTYIDENGTKETPVMIHAAIFGSFERMTGILLEHYAGALPMWLAPIQAIVLPIADRHFEYARQLSEELKNKHIRVELDDRSESIGKKIREAEMQKIPFMLIVGDKEIEAKKIAVRRYGAGDRGEMKVEKLIEEIRNEI